MEQLSGIYSITNTTNGKIYYGSAKKFQRRWFVHKNDLIHGKHANQHLQKAWNKYGSSSFRFDIVEEVPEFELKQVEQQYLDWIKVMPKTLFYNISMSADCPNRGMHLSEDTKKKISCARKGKFVGENCGMFGRVGSKHHFYGKHHSAEIRKRISESHMDKKIYSFKNVMTKEIFTGVRRDFYKRYNLHAGNVCDVVNGKLHAYKDWILV